MGIRIEMPDGTIYYGGADYAGSGGRDLGSSENCVGEPVPSGRAGAPDVDGKGRAGSSDSGFRPNAGQAKALEAIHEHAKRPGRQLVVLAGYAGTGKTTCLRELGKSLGDPAIVTPTGKAALRVTQATGLPAQTIHRWLYQTQEGPDGKLKFQQKPAEKLHIPQCKTVLIDEASMLGASLWADLWRVAQRFDLKIVLVGDGFQLPPVQERGSPPFSVMEPDFAAHHDGTRCELTEVLRQAQDAPIVRASMDLREGLGARALTELPKVTRDGLFATAVATYQAGGVVIAHTNMTRFRVNAGLHGYFFPGVAGPAPGEPLMVLRNNYDVDMLNGEQVTFEGWVKAPADDVSVQDRYTGKQAAVHFGHGRVNGRDVVLCLEEIDGALPDIGGLTLTIAAERWARQHGVYGNDGELAPFLQANYGYCYTAHKAQGSEWPWALVLLEPSVKLGETDGRRWAYTAITRAKQNAAVFYGRP